MHRAERVGAQHDLVERVTGRDAHVDSAEQAGGRIDHDAHAGTRSRLRFDHGVEQHGRAMVGHERRPVGATLRQRAFHEQRLLTEREGADVGRDPGPSTAR